MKEKCALVVLLVLAGVCMAVEDIKYGKLPSETVESAQSYTNLYGEPVYVLSAADCANISRVAFPNARHSLRLTDQVPIYDYFTYLNFLGDNWNWTVVNELQSSLDAARAVMNWMHEQQWFGPVGTANDPDNVYIYAIIAGKDVDVRGENVSAFWIVKTILSSDGTNLIGEPWLQLYIADENGAHVPVILRGEPDRNIAQVELTNA